MNFCHLLGLPTLVNSVFAGALQGAEPDRTRPRLLSAVVEESGETNRIQVKFDEPLLVDSARDKSNYALTLFGTTNQVAIQSAIYTGGLSPTVFLFVWKTNWHVGGATNYYLTVNRVRDLAGNAIAPDSRVGLAWPHYTEVLQPNAVWRYPVEAPGVFQQPWASCGYVESGWWEEAPAPFWRGNWPPRLECFGAGTDLLFHSPGPLLFRTKFVCSPECATNSLLRFDWLVEAGAIFYLNGVEVLRVNLCPAPADLTNQATACCVNFIAPPQCGSGTFAVTNLAAGTNCLAVAVLPCYCLPVSICSGSELAFGLRLLAARLVPGPVPLEPLPTLQIAHHSIDAVKLWWTGSGYALETTTNLSLGVTPSAFIPWEEVPDLSNPYTNLIQPHTSRFYRLKK